MRDFNQSDRKKKTGRIQLPDNPSGLTHQQLQQLEETVLAALQEGYLPCPLAWKIADQAGVPRIAVGAVLDSLGKRVTDCQLGCFKVDKTPFAGSVSTRLSGEVVNEIRAHEESGWLKCRMVFELADRYGLKPIEVAGEINMLGVKVCECQLGCF